MFSIFKWFQSNFFSEPLTFGHGHLSGGGGVGDSRGGDHGGLMALDDFDSAQSDWMVFMEDLHEYAHGLAA